MTIRNIRKQLIVKQDLALGKGKVIQRRGDENRELDKLDLVMALDTVEELRATPGDYDKQQCSVADIGVVRWGAASELADDGISVFAVTGVDPGRWILIAATKLPLLPQAFIPVVAPGTLAISDGTDGGFNGVDGEGLYRRSLDGLSWVFIG